MRVLLLCLLIWALVPGWAGEQRLPLFEGRRPCRCVGRAEPARPGTAAGGGLDLSGRNHPGEPVPCVRRLFVAACDRRPFHLAQRWRQHPALSHGGGLAAARVALRQSARRALDGVDEVRSRQRIAGGRSAHRAALGRVREFQPDLALCPRFCPGGGHVAPRAMENWPGNGGAESMARMPDGRFVVISEVAEVERRFWRGGEARVATVDRG